MTRLSPLLLFAVIACGSSGSPKQLNNTTHTISGSVSGLSGTLVLQNNGAGDLTVTSDGAFAFSAGLAQGANYAVTVGTQPVTQVCTVANGTGIVGAGNVTTISVTCNTLYFQTGMAASIVIGEPNFTTSTTGLSSTTFVDAYGSALVYNNTLYVADFRGNRVLGYDTLPTTNGAAADFVIDQNDFISGSLGTGPTGLNNAESVTADGNIFAINDTGNNRVLLYSAAPRTTGPATPTVVVGQADFNSTAHGCTASGIYRPENALLSHGKLLVADSDNNRVMIWNTVPQTNGAPADLVLGQGNFTSCAAAGTPSASSLNYPVGLWTDGQRLVVADGSNARVLIWNTFPTTNGAPADVVLGQPDMVSSNANLTASGFSFSYFLDSDGVRLAVSDQSYNRVLLWNTMPTTNNAPADVVIGQSDFVSSNGNTTATTLSGPAGVMLLNSRLFITDEGNERILIFNATNPNG